MSTGFWESLRIGFLQLRQECAINPPSAPAGRLTAIWTAQPPPGEWELSYWEGVDGYGVTKRFEWHAQSAAARLGFGETGQKAVWFWLDRVRSDAPESHLRPHLIEGSDGDGQMFSVEILDICGLSAEYCRKCEADENRAAFQNEILKPSVEQTSTAPERLAAPTLVLNAERGRDEHSSGNVSYQKAPFFKYQYARDFPDAEQLSIENARLDANLQLENRAVHSYDEHRAARTEWFWNVVSAAATAIGRAGDTLKWGANRRREMLLDFGFQAAQSVGLAGRDGVLFRDLCKSEKWRALDDRLLRPPASGDCRERENAAAALPGTLENGTFHRNASEQPRMAADTTRSVSEPNREPAQRSSPDNSVQATAVLERPSLQLAPRKARGRPVKIPDELKERALGVKGGKERAKILYQTRYPTVQQVKNVPTILRHFNRKRQPKTE
jgi:hypothetical protein